MCSSISSSGPSFSSLNFMDLSAIFLSRKKPTLKNREDVNEKEESDKEQAIHERYYSEATKVGHRLEKNSHFFGLHSLEKR